MPLAKSIAFIGTLVSVLLVITVLDNTNLPATSNTFIWVSSFPIPFLSKSSATLFNVTLL